MAEWHTSFPSQVISLEGWTDVMYFVQDAHSFWNWIYFVMLIVVSKAILRWGNFPRLSLSLSSGAHPI